MSNIWNYGWPIIVIVGIYAFYQMFIQPKMAETSQVLGKAQTVAKADGVFAKFTALLSGWKTIILAVVAGLPQFVQLLSPEMLQSLQGLPWGEIFDPKVANAISFACAALIPITHVIGLNQAAKTTPQI